MDFHEMSQRMFSLYGEGRYEEGVELLEAASGEHPDRDSTITFWKGCLLGMAGRPEESLRTLEEGLDRGLWWAPGSLGDTGLDSVRTLPGWDAVVERCRVAVDTFVGDWTPRARVMAATDGPVAGTLVTLHGAGGIPDDHALQWRSATPSNWTVITPEGPVPSSKERREWARDHPDSESVAQLDGLDVTAPVVLAGYSQGSGVACWWGWNGLIEAVGLLLLGPGYFHWLTPELPKRLPTYIVVGENDFLLDACLEHQQLLEETGVPVLVDVRAGMGHQMPDDLDQVVGAAIEWFSAVS